jgi:hypothetical protein
MMRTGEFIRVVTCRRGHYVSTPVSDASARDLASWRGAYGHPLGPA